MTNELVLLASNMGQMTINRKPEWYAGSILYLGQVGIRLCHHPILRGPPLGQVANKHPRCCWVSKLLPPRPPYVLDYEGQL
jgi:hypothetical protein